MPDRAAPPRALIVAGGTGGHVFPALAIAEALSRAGVAPSWLGAGGMEERWVRGRGMPFYVVPFRPPSGVGGALRLAVAVCRAYGALRRARPAVVLAMGGYAAVPGGIAAWLSRTPLIIHEQNAVAGRANRLLRRFATRTLTGFPDAIPGGRHVGNPARRGFFAARPAADGNGELRLLTLGGSQGARALNVTVPAALALLGAERRPAWRVTHQCGAGAGEATAKAYREAGVVAVVREFIDDVAAAMRAADLVICRAGASTLAELAAVGVASVLAPYPHAAADHQTANAGYFAARRAAVLRAEKDLTPARLADFLRRADRRRLRRMAARCARLAAPNAAAEIADYCLREARHAA